jgi:hypothetical protein
MAIADIVGWLVGLLFVRELWWWCLVMRVVLGVRGLVWVVAARAGSVVVDGDDALRGWIAMELFLAGFAVGICRCRSGPRRGVSVR